ncbi:MAG TPA: serine/threonine-protein kinase [Gemmataceae bacterium]|nr:serine/threonine-protein kinase [Gemmataceae bacterium]
MSQTTFSCPHCKQLHPVSYKDLGKELYCPQNKAALRLTRLNDYILLDVLGGGAFGIVYRAYDMHNQREVALKQLNEKIVVPEDEFDALARRAVKEARALAKIDFHPNVLPLYTSGCVDRRFYMVTPIIRGRTLEKMIPVGGFPDPRQAVRLAVVMLRALEHVHSFKVYHRDVKPSNVMIDGNGHLFLVDFGLASFRTADTVHQTQTEMGTVLGTAAFMPPEQARGEINRVGPWSDQYSTGVVLFKMLSGAVPYPGKGYAVLGDVANDEKPPQPLRTFRPSLDPALEAVVMKSLAKFPGERFGSCAEFADRLQAWLDSQTGPAPPLPEPPPGERSGGWSRLPASSSSVVAPSEAPKNRAAYWAALTIVAAALVAGAGYVVWQYSSTPPTPASSLRFFDPTKKPAAP